MNDPRMNQVITAKKPYEEAAKIVQEHLKPLYDDAEALKFLGITPGTPAQVEKQLIESVSGVLGRHQQVGQMLHVGYGKMGADGTNAANYTKEGGRFFRAADLNLSTSAFEQYASPLNF